MSQLLKLCSRGWRKLVVLGLSVMFLVITLPAFAVRTPQQNMQQLDHYIEQAIEKTEAKDLQQAATIFEKYRTEWFDVEDGVKGNSRQAYKEIEQVMGEVKFAFSNQPPDRVEILKSLNQLHQVNQTFINGRFKATESTPSAPTKVTVKTLIERLNRAETAIANQDISTAVTEIKQFQTDWLEVEGIVATKSKDAYVNIENNMGKAYGFLNASTPDIKAAENAIGELKQDLQPYASEDLRYNFVDAALILIREGMEALLVLIALLAFLNKSGNSHQTRWLWLGTGLGVIASIITGVVIQIFFANLTGAGANREMLEGFTGLIAATMLFYISYWLHSKSSLDAWQGYIRNQATSALASQSVFSLSLLAFLAVFREGGETVLFYIGIAPSISNADLIGGLALGTIILVIAAILILGLGLKIPLKPFFLITSLLIYYLGFKFVGSGIHALQVAKIISTNPANFLPNWEPLGLYPTWETTLVQISILLVALALVWLNRSRELKKLA